MSPIAFEKNEIKTFVVELDLSRECITPDWSFTAQGELGEIEVSHIDNTESDKMPYLDPSKARTKAAENQTESSAPKSDSATT